MSFQITPCPFCSCGCALVVQEDGGHLVGIHPSLKHQVARGGLCMRGWNAAGAARHPDRLTEPLIRSAAGILPVSSDRAVEEIAGRLSRQTEPGASHRILFLVGPGVANEDASAARKLAAYLGAKICPSDIGGAVAARQALKTAFGISRTPLDPAEIAGADLVWAFGTEPEACPQVHARIVSARQAGARIVTFDVPGLASSDGNVTHVTIPPDQISRLPLVLHRAAVDLGRGTDAPPPAILDAPWLDRARAQELAKNFLAARRPVIIIGERFLSYADAVSLTTQLLLVVALLGAADRVVIGAGEANSWGVLDVLDTRPDDLRPYLDLLSPDRDPGITSLVVLGDDLIRRTPMPDVLAKKLEKLDLLVVLDRFPTNTTPYAHVVLPTAGFAEVDGTCTNTFGVIQRCRRAVPAPGASAPDRAWLARIGQHLGLSGWAEGAEASFLALQDQVSAYGAPGLARLFKDPSAVGVRIPEGAPHPAFTLLGSSAAGPRESSAEYPLRLVLGFHPAHWSTGTQSDRSTPLRREASGSQVFACGDDLAAAGIKPGWSVTIVTPTGRATLTARADARLPRGVVLAVPLPGSPAAALRGFLLDPTRTTIGQHPVPARLEKA